MVPPVTVHTSVPLAVVVAVLPVELAQTDDAVEMDGVGGLSLTVTLVLLVAEQLEALVAFRLTVAVPLAPRSEERRVGNDRPVRVPPVPVHSRVQLAVVVAVLPVEMVALE